MPRLLVDGRDVCFLDLRRSLAERSKGLLRVDSVEGALWLEPCRQVHTIRMRFAIDVAYVDRTGRVLSVTTMSPNRMGALRLRARATVEAQAGQFAAWGLSEGSLLTVVS